LLQISGRGETLRKRPWAAGLDVRSGGLGPPAAVREQPQAQLSCSVVSLFAHLALLGGLGSSHGHGCDVERGGPDHTSAVTQTRTDAVRVSLVIPNGYQPGVGGASVASGCFDRWLRKPIVPLIDARNLVATATSIPEMLAPHVIALRILVAPCLFSGGLRGVSSESEQAATIRNSPEHVLPRIRFRSVCSLH